MLDVVPLMLYTNAPISQTLVIKISPQFLKPQILSPTPPPFLQPYDVLPLGFASSHAQSLPLISPSTITCRQAPLCRRRTYPTPSGRRFPLAAPPGVATSQHPHRRRRNSRPDRSSSTPGRPRCTSPQQQQLHAVSSTPLPAPQPQQLLCRSTLTHLEVYNSKSTTHTQEFS